MAGYRLEAADLMLLKMFRTLLLHPDLKFHRLSTIDVAADRRICEKAFKLLIFRRFPRKNKYKYYGK